VAGLYWRPSTISKKLSNSGVKTIHSGFYSGIFEALFGLSGEKLLNLVALTLTALALPKTA